MARALLGHVGTSNEHVLAYEVARLRRRVAELEGEVQRLRDAQAEVSDLDLHRELHSLTAADAEPALA